MAYGDDVSAADVDAYLAALDEPRRSTLAEVRRCILEVVPDGEEVISYGMPAVKVDGKVVAGFAAFTAHLSYLPHSSTVLDVLGDRLTAYECSKGALRFAVDEPLPPDLVRALVEARLAEAGLT